MSDLEQRITKLETVIAFQDETIEELSSHIYELQKEIQACQNELSKFKESVQSQSEFGDDGMQKPPHY